MAEGLLAKGLALLKYLLQQVWELLPGKDAVVSGVKLIAGESAEAKALRRKLKELKYQLNDSNGKLGQNESERNQMAQMIDLEYRVEDAIEEYDVGKRISYSRAKIIKELLEEITQKIDEVERIIDQSSVATPSKKTSSDFDEEDCFVGKESELNHLVSLLVDEKTDRVISLWGMAGIGKTTMAREAFHRMMTKDEAKSFKAFVWVCVTRHFDCRSLLKDVLTQLIQAEGKKDSEVTKHVSGLSIEELITKLREKQAEKRCLIVLDNVWETFDWNMLKQAFTITNPASQSKVLITTRDEEKAKTGLEVKVELLNLDAGWELLKKKTFYKVKIPANFSLEDPDVIKIGKELVESCGCLPQAISILGGVLKHKEISLREWELVAEDMRKYIDKHGSQEGKELDAAITLSYNALPYHLKLCFVYLGILREDESIRVGVLYHMWIAQGMISDKNSPYGSGKASLMEIAEQHLSDLASRSIVLVERDHGVKRKQFTTCKLHKSVRRVCLDLGEKLDNLVRLVDYEGGSFSKCLVDALKFKPRHLVIRCKEKPQDDGDFSFESNDDCGRLRSLYISNDMEEVTKSELKTKLDIRKFKSLKSLVFQGFKFTKGTSVDKITQLVLLRYLCFRSCEIDVKLPSMEAMFYLDTLDLFKSRFSSDLQNMPKTLKHLFLPRYTSNSKGTAELQETLQDLESLMEFDSKVHEVSERTEVIIQNLERFSARMHDSPNLLKILAAINKRGKKLVNCIVTVHDGCKITETEIKEAFKCKYLPTLGIYVPLEDGLFNKCRDNIISSKIACLELEKCEIKEDPMEILGNLPCLTELTLRVNSFSGEKMTCQKSSFPCLKILILSGLPKFSNWGVEHKAMEVLSVFLIQDCPALEIVPDGLSRISTLRKVVIRRMPAFISGFQNIKQNLHKDCRFSLNVSPNKPTFEKAFLTQSLAQRSSSTQPQEEIGECSTSRLEAPEEKNE